MSDSPTPSLDACMKSMNGKCLNGGGVQPSYFSERFPPKGPKWVDDHQIKNYVIDWTPEYFALSVNGVVF